MLGDDSASIRVVVKIIAAIRQLDIQVVLSLEMALPLLVGVQGTKREW
jgi:hypothetical protein